jgi:tetratricopeptide (TPR) repeat protein
MRLNIVDLGFRAEAGAISLESMTTVSDGMKPLCFVLMPFGRKVNSTGQVIDFDAIYQGVIAPAVKAAGLEGLRADEEQVGGTIHKPMYERLMLCEFAVADVTGANPNVYYELGIRHAIRPRSTVIIFAEGTLLPFDIALLRGIPYRLDSTGKLVNPKKDIQNIVQRLRTAHEDPHDDSPIFTLIDDMPRVEVDREKTDLFRDRVNSSRNFKSRLLAARQEGVEALRKLAAELPPIPQAEAGIVVELFLSFRAVKADQEMVDLYARMSRALQRTRIIQEQLAFALNRLGRADEAERVLKQTIAQFGQSSETNGLLGRVYKDRWESAKREGRALEARAFLKHAIEAYRTGFESDWRDPYPGVNAVTLMELLDKSDPAQADILPVVRYAALQRVKAKGDYWDHATLLELAVLARNTEEAQEYCGTALAGLREVWEPETTARNLRLIREARSAKDEDCTWIKEIEETLVAAQRRLEARQKNAGQKK